MASDSGNQSVTFTMAHLAQILGSVLLVFVFFGLVNMMSTVYASIGFAGLPVPAPVGTVRIGPVATTAVCFLIGAAITFDRESFRGIAQMWGIDL